MNDSMKRVSTITFLLGLASLASADVVLPKIIAGHAEEPLIVAHRGASRDAPSNTIPAFQLAWKQGADAIEGDFHLSKDGEIVCFHDADTKRVAGTQLVVRQST